MGVKRMIEDIILQVSQDFGKNLPLGGLWGTLVGFVALFVAGVFAIGATSRNLSIGAVGAYTAFAHFAIETEDTLLVTLFTVTFVLVIVGTGFKLWRTEGFDG